MAIKRPSSGQRLRRATWSRESACSTCRSKLYNHGLTPPEYDALLASGCFVPGCTYPAKNLDHDHTICPQPHHTCDKCRRGPACVWHNCTIFVTLDLLVAGELTNELAALGIAVEIRRIKGIAEAESKLEAA